jgi:hypothetical protein
MNRPPSFTRSVAVGALAFALSFALTSGCGKKDPVTSDGGTHGSADAVGSADPDGGSLSGDGGSAGVDAGPPPCRFDDDCPQDKRCDDSSGKCIDAKPCQDDPATCNADGTYCDNVDGLGCRCVLAKAAPTPPAPYNGFCKRRKPPCTPCKDDEECGKDPNFFQNSLHNDGRCVKMTDGKTFCLERFTGATKCSCGIALTVNNASYCAPQNNSCTAGTFLCCKSDKDCPPEHPNCDETSQLCKDVCIYSFENQQTVGCRADQVCHVDPKFLTAKAVNYGAGRCGPTCKGDPECAALRPDFVCKPELKGGGVKASEPRCRPTGCVSDYECPDPGSSSAYKGYCDRGDGKCKLNSCRAGSDPVTGAKFNDCKGGYKCDNGVCLEQNCVEQGGGENACDFDQFCCGEDRNGNGKTDDDPCTNDASISLAKVGQCYKAPRPPWCKACTKDDECKGGGAPVSPKDPGKCLDFGPGGACIYGCTLRTQCPRGYECGEIPVDCSQDPKTCGDVSRCYDSGRKDQKGNPIKWCKCTTAGAVGGECPTNTRCNNSGTTCIITQGCLPGPRVCK